MNKYREIFAIMKKELRSYFISPIAYIVITIFLIFTGFFFFKDFFYYGQAEMRNLFQFLPLMFTFVIPAVTMRLFSEEKQTGSIEMLVTMPVSSTDIVIGKVLAGSIFSILMLAPTLIYTFTIIIVGSPDYGPIIGGYLGSILLGCTYTSIGALTSSLSGNQIIAFITGWAACFSLWLVDKIVFFLPMNLSFLQNFGTDYHFQNISKGIIDTRDLIYFISLIILSILFTAKILEERR